MSTRFYLAAALVLIAATAACGGGGLVLPNPQGNFSNASLSGSYVYEIHGFDTSGNPYRQVGVFTANGNGNITGGNDDSSFAASATPVTGSYTIGKDGTGVVSLNTSAGAITLAITLVSSSKVQLIESDSFANAAGTAELQAASPAIPSGTFVFRLHQEISAENGAPASEVGAISVSTGSAGGSMDQNLAGSFSSPNVTATFAAPNSAGRGTGTLTNSTTSFVTDFVYYVVSSNKFVMLVSNVSAVGSGVAELQSGAVGNGLSGNYAFGSRGDDLTPFSGFFAGIATVGQFNAASGTISGNEDSSFEGTISSNVNFSSCFSAAANGRVTVVDVSGNVCTSTLTQVFWMVNPSRAFFVNAGTTSVEDGTADLQSAQKLSVSSFKGQYSLVMDGLDLSPELLSRVGTLQFDGSGKLKLNEVVNASGSGVGASSPGLIAGTYSVASDGVIVGTMSGIDLVMYPVSPSQGYVLQIDSGTVTSGVQLQQ